MKIAGLNLLASNFCTAFPTDISIITKQKFLHNVIKTPFYITTHNNQAISKQLVDSLLSQVWYTIIENKLLMTDVNDRKHHGISLLACYINVNDRSYFYQGNTMAHLMLMTDFSPCCVNAKIVNDR